MRNLYFEDFEDLACDIADKFDMVKDDFGDISIIAKPNEVKEIFKELVCIGYDICNITYESIDCGGYDDEYILSMNHDGIWIEKFKGENGYLTGESTITYILGNCSSKVIPYCKGKIVFEVTVGIDEDDECECACKKDEKPTATSSTSTSKSTYKVNGKECDKETYDEALRTIEDMYTKNIREALSDYSDMIDEMYKWKRLLNW